MRTLHAIQGPMRGVDDGVLNCIQIAGSHSCCKQHQYVGPHTIRSIQRRCIGARQAQVQLSKDMHLIGGEPSMRGV
jgi:hypothetical protein